MTRTKASEIKNRQFCLTLVRRIQDHLRAGGAVQLTTYTRSVIYKGSKHIDSFRVGKTGAYVRRGRNNWDCFAISAPLVRIGFSR